MNEPIDRMTQLQQELAELLNRHQQNQLAFLQTAKELCEQLEKDGRALSEIIRRYYPATKDK